MLRDEDIEDNGQREMIETETEGGGINRDDWDRDEREVEMTETEVGVEMEMREVETVVLTGPEAALGEETKEFSLR